MILYKKLMLVNFKITVLKYNIQLKLKNNNVTLFYWLKKLII